MRYVLNLKAGCTCILLQRNILNTQDMQIFLKLSLLRNHKLKTPSSDIQSWCIQTVPLFIRRKRLAHLSRVLYRKSVLGNPKEPLGGFILGIRRYAQNVSYN